MRRVTFTHFAVCTLALTSVANALPGQQRGTPQSIEVFLNGRHLLWAHAHVTSGDSPIGIDQGCVAQSEIARVLAGQRHVQRRGTNLDAVTPGAGTGAVLRVQRRGRISSRLHRNGDQDYIPLLDFVRALGAKIVPDGSARINLVLERSAAGAIFGLNDPARRR